MHSQYFTEAVHDSIQFDQHNWLLHPCPLDPVSCLRSYGSWKVKCCFTLSTNNSTLNAGRTKQVIPQVYVYLPTLIPCLFTHIILKNKKCFLDSIATTQTLKTTNNVK